MRFDGEIIQGCPYKIIGNAPLEMLSYYADWEKGHTPVTMGRAPWLTTRFIQGMHHVRACVRDAEHEYAEAQRKKVDVRRNPRAVTGGPRG